MDRRLSSCLQSLWTIKKDTERFFSENRISSGERDFFTPYNMYLAQGNMQKIFPANFNAN